MRESMVFMMMLWSCGMRSICYSHDAKKMRSIRGRSKSDESSEVFYKVLLWEKARNGSTVNKGLKCVHVLKCSATWPVGEDEGSLGVICPQCVNTWNM
jgi:hypothetical protein